MNKLWLYQAVSSLLRINYRSKILLIAFAGIQLPLLALILYFVRVTAPTGGLAFRVLAIVLGATLGGTLLTLFLLNHILQPIFLTSRSLKRYAQEGVLPQLPTQFTDEAGTLMADAQQAVLQLDASLRQLTDFDQVTALPNRHAFMRILSRELPAGMDLALCAMSASNYDKIAAAFGQTVVNSAMAAIAVRLREILGDEVPLSRPGSNTFIFALELPQGEDKLAARIDSIRLAVENELLLPGLSIRPEINAGVSLHAGGIVDAERLINEAISAMADSHVESPIHTNFFSPKQNEQAREAFLLERDLRIAIDEEQFSVHYQPIVDTALGKVVGAEALVRWTHPERGMVSPAAFIPIAEAGGLMDAIGMRVLQQVCRQLGQWAGTPLDALKVSINLSARQFLNPDAVQQIREALDANRVSPLNLEIELTETTVIQDTQRTLLILQLLRKMGITIAIDDFGTGYSGLSYLKTLPFDRLKIDREFIQNVDQTVTSMAICKSLIELASGLGIEVLAEGAETAAEVGMMRSLGCGLYQGYHFARPLPPEQFLEAVRIIEASLAPLVHSPLIHSSTVIETTHSQDEPDLRLLSNLALTGSSAAS
jgi:EAL domain-containing protein (putative c-di-GMP-specific phosphodiesterase class I)/GGDEF domain-containing protein